MFISVPCRSCPSFPLHALPRFVSDVLLGALLLLPASRNSSLIRYCKTTKDPLVSHTPPFMLIRPVIHVWSDCGTCADLCFCRCHQCGVPSLEVKIHTRRQEGQAKAVALYNDLLSPFLLSSRIAPALYFLFFLCVTYVSIPQTAFLSSLLLHPTPVDIYTIALCSFYPSVLSSLQVSFPSVAPQSSLSLCSIQLLSFPQPAYERGYKHPSSVLRCHADALGPFDCWKRRDTLWVSKEFSWVCSR